jgi:hypothetical protein
MMPKLYASRGFTIDELVRIYARYCTDLADDEGIWISGYDEFLFYRSDIEIRKDELNDAQKEEVRKWDKVVLKYAYKYLIEYEFGDGLLDDSYREKRYPISHWWWYVDRIKKGTLEPPNL